MVHLPTPPVSNLKEQLLMYGTVFEVQCAIDICAPNLEVDWKRLCALTNLNVFFVRVHEASRFFFKKGN